MKRACTQEAAMIRSRTVNTIHELAAQGKSIQDIAISLGIARNTVRKYVRHPELCAMPRPRPNRRSKLDPFKEQVTQWMQEDHCYNCEAMLPRLRFVTFVKRCDGPTLIRCLMEAFEYFGGLPKAALTDRMKSVLLVEMEGKMPRWNPRFADFMASIGVAPRVCRAYTPQTKGKIERSVGFAKQSLWAGVCFSDIDDLNRQAHIWCERINSRVHRTTHERPRDRREQEPLAPLPEAFAWERFATEERKVSWDGYLSYDGVLYGLPSSPPAAGAVVQVRDWHGILKVWSAGQLLAELAKRPVSQTHVEHPDQWRNVAPVASRHAQIAPIGHLRLAPQVVKRELAEYDHLCGVEVLSCNLT